MSTGFSIDLAEAAAIVQRLESAIGQLQTQMKNIVAEKDALLRHYEGEGATAFQQVQSLWDQGQADIEKALGQLRLALADARNRYAHASRVSAEAMHAVRPGS